MQLQQLLKLVCLLCGSGHLSTNYLPTLCDHVTIQLREHCRQHSRMINKLKS